MTTKTQSGALVELVQQSMLNGTRAGTNVFVARTWPARLGEVPILIVDPLYDERRSATGKAAPEFDTVTTITIRGRVSAVGQADDAGGLEVAEELELFKREIEAALINYTPIMRIVSHFPAIESHFTLSTSGEKNIGEVVISLAMASREGPEDFAPIDTAPLQEVNIFADMRNPFDPLHTYSETPFKAAPPPRESGPDGRLESALKIDTTV